MEHQRSIEKGYLKRIKVDDLITRVDPNQYQSLAQLKRAINQDNQDAIQELKRIQITNSESPMNKNVRLEIDRILDQQKGTINSSIQQQLNTIRREEQDLLQKLWKKYRQQADLRQNDERIWDDVSISPIIIDKIREEFDAFGLISVDQILQIDINEGFFQLKNGRKVNWRSYSKRRALLRNLARWHDELRLKAMSLSEEEARIKKGYQQVRQSLTEEKRIALEGLTDVHKKELQKAIIALPVEQLGAPYERLQRQYQTVVEQVEALEVEFSAEAEGTLSAHETAYNAILEKSQAQVEQSQARLIQLEAQLEGQAQRFQRAGSHKQYLKLQKAVATARDTLSKAQNAAREAERYRNIGFRQYVEAILKTK